MYSGIVPKEKLFVPERVRLRDVDARRWGGGHLWLRTVGLGADTADVSVKTGRATCEP